MTQIDDIARARRVPSLQLAGTPDRSTLDLNALTGIGVTLVGRLAGIANGKAQFAGSLRNMCALSDLKMDRLAGHHSTHGRATTASTTRSSRRSACRPRGSRTRRRSASTSPAATIKTIIWATGYRPDYTWLELPVLDRKGMVRHDGGVADLPGLYLMGLHFMRRRKSTLIDGAGDDARDLSEHLASYLDGRAAKQRLHPGKIASPSGLLA